jgi:hypothetical protein
VVHFFGFAMAIQPIEVSEDFARANRLVVSEQACAELFAGWWDRARSNLQVS